MPLSELARKKILQLIADHHLAFQAEVLGHDAISHENYERLVRNGVLRPGSVEHTQVALPAAHTIGKMASSADMFPEKSSVSLARMPPDKFWAFIATAPPQFDQHELDAIQSTKEHVGRLITNLAVMLMHDFEHATHEEATKLRHEALATVQHEIALGIARRQSKEQIERRLRKKLKDASRDWALIVATELHNAQEHGKALALARGGHDPLVYKEIRPDACRFCRMLYMNGKRPRVFKLSELVSNGTNYGRKAVHPTRTGKTEWRAVIGATHPACQCELRELPAGYSFDTQGKLVQTTRKATSDEMTAGLRALIGHRCEV